MKHPKLLNLRIQGFTLIETLIVMVVLGISAVVVSNLSGNLFMGKVANRSTVEGTQLMQQCAEQILAIPRSGASINAVTTNSCNNVPAGNVNTINLYCNGDSSKQTGSPASCTNCANTCEVEIATTGIKANTLLQLYRY